MACSEQEGVGSPDEEALFASQEGVKRPTVLATGTGLYKKVEAARSECEGDGASDVEVLFASLTTRRRQCKEWKQQRFIKNKRESQLLSK